MMMNRSSSRRSSKEAVEGLDEQLGAGCRSVKTPVIMRWNVMT